MHNVWLNKGCNPNYEQTAKWQEIIPNKSVDFIVFILG